MMSGNQITVADAFDSYRFACLLCVFGANRVTKSSRDRAKLDASKPTESRFVTSRNELCRSVECCALYSTDSNLDLRVPFYTR